MYFHLSVIHVHKLYIYYIVCIVTLVKHYILWNLMFAYKIIIILVLLRISNVYTMYIIVIVFDFLWIRHTYFIYLS